MTRLVTAMLAKNEAGDDRYLRRVLARCRAFSDDILLLDDDSADDTREVAREAGCVVATRTGTPAWGAEAPARRELWERAAALAGDGWVLIADADMILAGDPRPLCASWDMNAWAFPLYDLWGEDMFRCDGYWQGHVYARPWLFCPSRVPASWVARWAERDLHCGHAPNNFPLTCGIAPSNIYWLHYAYSTAENRRRKHTQYLSREAILTPFEKAHAESILDV